MSLKTSKKRDFINFPISYNIREEEFNIKTMSSLNKYTILTIR